jgi:hypothetical protein
MLGIYLLATYPSEPKKTLRKKKIANLKNNESK